MSKAEETFKKTMRSKAAIDAAANVKKFYELIKSGVDPMTAFLQVYMGIYHLVAPGPPRPDYLMSLSELHVALKDAHSYYSQMKDESKTSIEFIETLLNEPDYKSPGS
ncbi:MAG: hypothetical protein U9R66_08765 [Thermodesulfobacteriota bacterium]|nr:hypothetical protein [Thermodesulfobacteriota bacterium]